MRVSELSPGSVIQVDHVYMERVPAEVFQRLAGSPLPWGVVPFASPMRHGLMVACVRGDQEIDGYMDPAHVRVWAALN